MITLAGRSGHFPRYRKFPPTLCGVVTEKVHGFAQFRHAIRNSLARFADQQRHQFTRIRLEQGRSTLEHIAGRIAGNGVLILLGSGEREFEQRVLEIAGRCERLVFLRGYSESLADPLYRAGDLFLMPSSFEPCGISQMLAMRAAQPCVVHGVGGLCDTVDDGRTGFVFGGSNPGEQAGNFVAAVDRALALKSDANENWQKLCIRAASERFDWKRSATRTIEELYEPEH